MQRRRIHHHSRRDRAMRLNGLSSTIIISVLILVLTPFTTYDKVSCVVKYAHNDFIDGYYAGIGGLFIRKGQSSLLMPDYFDLLSLRQVVNPIAISLTEGKWQITNQGKTEYISQSTENVDYPPKQGWTDSDSKASALRVVDCRGSLQNSPDAPDTSRESNLQALYNRPVNTILLGTIFYIFFLLLTNRLDKNSVLISYDSIVNKEEYYRIVSASLSHFDWMHLIFNAVSLFQIGDIEVLIGSGKYFYLSADLVIITMLICIAIQHFLITRMNRTDMIQQQSLGYSCVLFAWMVVFSVRLKKFCPIFLFPSLCFSTYVIRFPFIKAGFPVNFGPIVLLVFTKVLLPQSSFLGHLSGIIIGYPLAWSLLNWLTPPLLIGLITTTIIFKKRLFIWEVSSFETARTTNNFHEFVPFLQHTWMLILSGAAGLSTAVYTLVIFFFGWKQTLVRGCLIFLSWSSVFAIRCCWLASDGSGSVKSCCDIILTTFIVSLLALGLDVASLGGLIGAGAWVSSEVAISSYIPYGVFIMLLIFSIVMEAVMCIGLWYGLRDLRVGAVWLEALRFDPLSIDQDLHILGFKALVSLGRRAHEWIAPRLGNRLGGPRMPLDDRESTHLVGINHASEPIRTIGSTVYSPLPQAPPESTHSAKDPSKPAVML